MSQETMDDLRQRLDAEFGDGWEITESGDLLLRGESADGCPDWTVGLAFGVVLIRYELGWYVQEGEGCIEDAIMIMRAMENAAKALNDSIRRSKETDHG